MENLQLSYRMHPFFLPFAIEILEREKISFELKYESLYGMVGSFNLKMVKPLEGEVNANAMKILEASSSAQLAQEETRMKRLSDIDMDYERIRSDMNALIFHASLDESDSKSKKKRKTLAEMLHSDLAKHLRPPIKGNSH